MTKDKALKLALEALESKYIVGCGVWRAQQVKAITAIKEALAQSEQKPVAYLCENAVGHKYFRWKKPSSTYKPIALYTTPPVQPKQEPVGKFAKFTDGIWREVTDGSAGISLYTTPPKREWVELTDAECMDACDPFMGNIERARAILAKSKELNT